MKTLFVLRHAKSSWSNPGLRDFERPLNKRGRLAAPRIGKEMAARNYRPEIIISSPAERAKQTTSLVVEAAGLKTPVTFDPGIYGSGVNSLVYIVSEIPDTVESAMIVGHNPGFEYLVETVTGLSERMPTAALAVIRISGESWSEFSSGCGDLIDLLRPKDLD